MDVRRLEAALVDVVEGEGLRGVGAILVHLHRRPGAALDGGLTLRLLPPRRHDFRESEGHDAEGKRRLSLQQLAETVPAGGQASRRTQTQTELTVTPSGGENITSSLLLLCGLAPPLHLRGTRTL